MTGDPRLWITLTCVALLTVAFGLTAPHQVRRRAGRRHAGAAACRVRCDHTGAGAAAGRGDHRPAGAGAVLRGPGVPGCRAARGAPRRGPPGSAGWSARTGSAIAAGGGGPGHRDRVCHETHRVAGLAGDRRDDRRPRRQTRGMAFRGRIGPHRRRRHRGGRPAALAKPSVFLHNIVLYPLGLTRHVTPAASPLPGHLLAATGAAGHWAAICLLLAAGLAVAAWILIRRPRRPRRRLAPGRRPVRHGHPRARHPVGILRLPPRPARLARPHRPPAAPSPAGSRRPAASPGWPPPWPG